VALPSECLHLRGWERKEGENLQRGYQGRPTSLLARAIVYL
jgi:hypothetical protein